MLNLNIAQAPCLERHTKDFNRRQNGLKPQDRYYRYEKIDGSVLRQALRRQFHGLIAFLKLRISSVAATEQLMRGVLALPLEKVGRSGPGEGLTDDGTITAAAPSR